MGRWHVSKAFASVMHPLPDRKMMEVRHFHSRGFSLIEMIIVISVLGILTASIAVFLRGPIASYFDTERRVDIANAGELAMAKMAYEISRAVPNSVRITTVGAGFYLEFLPLVSGVGEGVYEASGPFVPPVNSTTMRLLAPKNVTIA